MYLTYLCKQEKTPGFGSGLFLICFWASQANPDEEKTTREEEKFNEELQRALFKDTDSLFQQLFKSNFLSTDLQSALAILSVHCGRWEDGMVTT